METILFRMVYEQDKPLLGICRGIQYINVVMGGTLYQDLPSEHPSDTEHHQMLIINSEKIFPLFSSTNQENSGCHCIPQINLFFGTHTASIKPSS